MKRTERLRQGDRRRAFARRHGAPDELRACSAALFAGAPDALYERHLKFDNIVEPETANKRERYEAAARAVRDILSDRWLRTDKTYARENPKRIYYVSIEFLIGRSLGNNVMNLMLDPIVGPSFDERRSRMVGDPRTRSRTRASAMAASGGSRPASSTRWRRCSCPRWATACATSTASSSRKFATAGRRSARTTGSPSGSLGGRAPGGKRPGDVRLLVRIARRHAAHDPEQSFDAVGVPYDRPVVGYGGKTVNTLRLWSATAAHSFDFQRFSGGDFVASIAEALNAELLTRVLYPDDHTPQGRALRLMQEYFLVACSLADIVRRFRRIELRLADAARQGRHSAQRHPSEPGGSRAHAHSARRSAARLGRGVGHHQAHARLHQPYSASRGARDAGRSIGCASSFRASSRSSTRSTAGFSTTFTPAFPTTWAQRLA